MTVLEQKIKEARQEERKEIIEMVEGMRKEFDPDIPLDGKMMYDPDHYEGFNHAIDRLKERLLSKGK